MEVAQVRSVGAAAEALATAGEGRTIRTQPAMLPLVDNVDPRRHRWHNLTDGWLPQSDAFSSRENHSSQAIQVGKQRGLIRLGRYGFG
jgi:hypothetical protein